MKVKEVVEKNSEHIKEIDWDFKNAKTTYLTHNYHGYPARFIPQIPKTLIKTFSSEGKLVLDPFCGCGTTLVESLLLGINSIGIDINPLAVLISKVKTTPIEPHKLKEHSKEVTNSITKTIKKLRGESLFSEPILDFGLPSMPKRKLTAKFTDKIKKEIGCIKAVALRIEDEDIRDFFLLALSSTIRTIVQSKTKNIDPLATFLQNIKIMTNRMEKFFEVCPKEYFSKIYCTDFIDASFLQDHSVDVIVTSPTYLNAQDYHREHMFNIFWLNDYLYNKFNMDFNTFRDKELGSHSHYIYNRFKTVYEYFKGLYKCFQQISRILKPDRFCCIVIGDSTLEREYINTHQYFKEIGKEVGLEVKFDILRSINVESKYLSKTIGKINQEHILIFRKINEEWENANPQNFCSNLLREMYKTCKLENKIKIIETLKEYS